MKDGFFFFFFFFNLKVISLFSMLLKQKQSLTLNPVRVVTRWTAQTINCNKVDGDRWEGQSPHGAVQFIDTHLPIICSTSRLQLYLIIQPSQRLHQAHLVLPLGLVSWYSACLLFQEAIGVLSHSSVGLSQHLFGINWTFIQNQITYLLPAHSPVKFAALPSPLLRGALKWSLQQNLYVVNKPFSSSCGLCLHSGPTVAAGAEQVLWYLSPVISVTL